MDIEDPYTAYCFDEACALVIKRLESGEKPVYKVHYSKPSDLYKKYR